MKNCLRAIHCF